MAQNERLNYLLRRLLAERGEYADIHVPDDLLEKRKLLRSLMNVRPPVPISAEFLAVQDAYLKERLMERGVTRLGDLKPAQPWRVSLAGRHYYALCRCHRQCGESSDAGLFRALSWLH